MNSADAIKLGQTISQQSHLQQPMLVLLAPKHSLSAQQVAEEAGFFTCLIKPVYPIEFINHLTAAWERWREEKERRNNIKLQQDKPKISVLLIENHDPVQRMHTALFERSGCKVEAAKNAEKIMEMLSFNKYDFIFVDIDLSNVEAVDVVIKIHHHLARINKPCPPIIGMADPGHEQSVQGYCLQVGMDEVISKLIKSHELEEFFQRWGANQLSKNEPG